MRKKICFIIMGYGKKTDYASGKTFDLDKTYLNIIKPAVTKAGYECVRGDEVQESGVIDKSMYSLLIYSELVIADITTFNPNALYELGIRHAARPFSTIIMKEKENSIPFDLNHNKIFHYSHMGEDIGASEAERCQNELHELIESIGKSSEVDSPLFQYISSVKPYELSEEDYLQLVKELSDKEKHIFAIVEHAKSEMSKSNFKEAAGLWLKASKKVDNDVFFIQQHALCTYKSKEPTEKSALTDALQIIAQLEPDAKTTNDPETLGISGAINKRIWLLDNEEVAYLDRAIKYYGKGFKITSDYYTGENYATCLDFKSRITIDVEEKIYYRIEAKKTRERIIEILQSYMGDDDFEKRSDLRWINATLANCHFALGDVDTYSKYEKAFYDAKPDQWEIETYSQSLEHIKNNVIGAKES